MSPNTIVSLIATVILLTSSGIAFSSVLPSLPIGLFQISSDNIASR